MSFANSSALALVLASVLAPVSAEAQICTKSWAAPANGLWTDATRWTPAGVPTAADDVCITVDGTYSVTIRGSQSANIVTVGQLGNLGVQTVIVEGIAAIGAQLTAASGITNGGAILLTSTAIANSTVAVTNGTLDNSGLIETLAGGGGARLLAANLLNTGTVFIDAVTTGSGIFENQASFTIGTGRSLTMGTGQLFRQSGGTLTLAGTGALRINQGTFELNGGNIAGRPIISSGNLRVGSGSIGTGEFSMRGNSTLAGSVAPAQTVIVEGISNLGSNLTAANGFTNAGTIRLTSTAIANAALSVTDGTLTNAGMIETLAGGGGARLLAADLVNTGTVFIDAVTTGSGIFENQGSFTIGTDRSLTMGTGQLFRQSGGTLTLVETGALSVNQGTFEFNGGSIAGRPIISSGNLRIGIGSVGPGEFSMRGNSTLAGDVAPAQTVIAEGISTLGSNLTAANGFTNAGTIRLTSSANANSSLAVTNGTLTNAGTVETLAGGGGARTLAANFLNTGTILLDANTTFSKPNGAYVNANLISLPPTRTLTIVDANQTFMTTGEIAGGGTLALTTITFRATGSIAAAVNLTSVDAHIGAAGPATLNVTGNYRMITGGTLNIELGGTTPGTDHDRLNVTGTATLLGTLAVRAVNDFCPAGDFTIATYGARVGDFAVKTGLLLADGRLMTATAGPTAYVISAPGTCVADTSTAVASAPNPSVFGQPVTLTATVTSGGSAVTVGSVTFKEGATVLATATLNAIGQASFSTSSLSVGSHVITAEYGGSARFNPSSGSVTHTVDKANTATTVTSSVERSVFGQLVTFTAAIAAVAPGTGTPTGTVLFREGATSLAESTLDANGQASFSTSFLSVGSHTITAEYGGSADFNSSSGSVTQAVDKADTTTTLVSSVNPSVFGQAVTFTATVAAVAPGSGTPAGTVRFSDGAAAIGAADLSSGVATFTTSTLAPGAHSIVAEYSGEANYNPSTGSLTQTVKAAGMPVVAVANRNDGTVSLIDAQTNLVVSTVAVGHKPVAVTFFDVSSGTFELPAKLYVAEHHADENPDVDEGRDGADGVIQVLAGPASPTESNAVDFTLGPAVLVGNRPQGVALNPDGRQLWAANRNDDSISVVDRPSDGVIATVPLSEPANGGAQRTTEIGKKPMAVAFSPDGKYAYVAGRNSDALVVLDAATRAILADVDVGDKPVALTASSDGTRVFVANRNGDDVAIVDVTNPAVPAVLARIPVREKPEGVALLNDGTRLYVTSANTNSVCVFDVLSAPPYARLRSFVSVGSRPWGIAVTRPQSFASGDFVYVANQEDGTVSVIDPATDTVIETIPVGKGPTGVAAGLLPTGP